jgi:hypothetical protein
MSAGDIGSIASALVALAALIVSLVSLRKTNKFGETTDRLNRMLIERQTAESLAERKADVSANLYQRGKNDYRLKVFNKGKGRAKNVRITDLDDKDDSLLMADEIREKFPLPILEQHQSVDLLACVTLGSHLRTHIKLQWDDDTGKDHEKELTPTI